MKIKVVCLSAALMLAWLTGVSGAEVTSVVVSDLDNAIVTVTGSASDTEDTVNIVILKSGETLLTGKYGRADGSIQSAEVIDGTFEAVFKFGAPGGEYSVYVSDADKPYEFEYIDKDTVLEFVGDLGEGSIEKNKIFGLLSKYAATLGVDISFAASNFEEEYLADSLISYSDRIKGNNINGLKEVVKLSRFELEFIGKLKDAVLTSNVNNLLNSYSISAEISLDGYSRLSEAQQITVCQKFIEAKYSSMQDFRTDFNNAVNDAVRPVVKPNGGGGGGGGGKASSVISKSTVNAVPSDNDKSIPEIDEFYTDISDNKWAWEYIRFVDEKGIMRGTGNGKFEPNAILNREQLAKIITVAFDMYDGKLTSDFNDVAHGDWADSYIASAKANNIMNGIDENNFGYGMAVTREDMCVVLYRTALLRGIKFENAYDAFSDFGSVSEYAAQAVSYMAGSGMVSGTGDGAFAPKSYATRVQTAKLIYMLIKE